MEEDFVYEPRSPEEKNSQLSILKRSASYQADQTVKHKEVKPSFPRMMFAVWSAPIVKFTTWFLIYVAFLVLIGVDMMLPSCTHLGVDIAVFAVTALIWLELVTR